MQVFVVLLTQTWTCYKLITRRSIVFLCLYYPYFNTLHPAAAVHININSAQLCNIELHVALLHQIKIIISSLPSLLSQCSLDYCNTLSLSDTTAVVSSEAAAPRILSYTHECVIIETLKLLQHCRSQPSALRLSNTSYWL